MTHPGTDHEEKLVGCGETPALPPSRVFMVFLRLGLLSFGGPVAHIGYFRRTFVEERGWIPEHVFLELSALAHFLPGPASSQLGYAIGARLAGAPGGLAAFAGFTLPSALIMFAFALALPHVPGTALGALIHGLHLVAAVMVTDAVIRLSGGINGPRAALTAVAAFLLAAFSDTALVLPTLILAGGLASLPGAARLQRARLIVPPKASLIPVGIFLAAAGLILLAGALIHHPAAAFASALFRSGSFVFGGGHVVLPLLAAEAETLNWMSSDTLMAGYGGAQILPGPLFAISAFLGAASDINLPAPLGAILGLCAIFSPGLLLMAAALPVWERLSSSPGARAFLAGAAAAGLGVLASALWDPVLSGALRHPADPAILAAACACLLRTRLPVPGVVAATAILGALSHRLL